MTGDYRPDFLFSDLVAGYVTEHDPAGRVVTLRTGDGRTVRAEYGTATAEMLRNLGEPYRDVTGRLAELLVPGRHLFLYGVFYPGRSGYTVEAKHVTFLGEQAGRYAFEDGGWWPHQLGELARFYRVAQFGQTSDPDFADYRTQLRLSGNKGDHHVQETDTISRLVYGMASAYMLSGDEDYLRIAERGTEYLRDHMRFVDRDSDVVYWYHGIDVRGGTESKIFTSEFDDDYRAIPAYEQIYALVGPTQTYRITGDPRIADDIDATLRLFHRYFKDHERGGYYSHIDPLELSPHHPSLGRNRSRKNWNSIGDHAPAYLLNLYLATGEARHADMLEECFDLIVERFPEEGSPFVQERFHEDWSADRTWGWQQDRAVVGHNLKIAWNLMRMNAIRPKDRYTELARHIGRTMPAVGADLQRHGWYDVVERTRRPGEDFHRMAWHDRKAWWQQEQAILAYQILAGNTGDAGFRTQARESAAFYNAFFLDHEEGGVYFNVLADGLPYLLGTERMKANHAMSLYHKAELCLLATVYERLLLNGEPLSLWFRPLPEADRTLRVAPDALPPGSVRLGAVEVDGSPFTGFDPDALTIELPRSEKPLHVRATLQPAR
ncbi:AGE family epimerase/isomerase [Streptomyces sp. WELS2]|uniref:AGE family epimerase/isomerase n=1 Tax=Streptomyces sp. WELS2 TaxID=2749435 RepID=UPI0015F03714|nr:AGE family epimerase/isomerase [Streptomyces sp. WELS2]